MKKLLAVSLVTTIMLLVGCGGAGGGSDSGGKTNSTAPVLHTIGDKTITLGDPALTFTVTATDPNNLTLMYSSDGSVGAGPNPYTETGNLASFNPNTHQFSWDVTGVAPDDYFVLFTVMNSNAESDSETIRIRVQAQPNEFTIGQQKYDANCSSCHGPEGRNGSTFLIQCVDSALFYEKVDGGSMSGYASSWSTSDKAAVLFYLNNVNPGAC